MPLLPEGIPEKFHLSLQEKHSYPEGLWKMCPESGCPEKMGLGITLNISFIVLDS